MRARVTMRYALFQNRRISPSPLYIIVVTSCILCHAVFNNKVVPQKKETILQAGAKSPGFFGVGFNYKHQQDIGRQSYLSTSSQNRPKTAQDVQVVIACACCGYYIPLRLEDGERYRRLQELDVQQVRDGTCTNPNAERVLFEGREGRV